MISSIPQLENQTCLVLGASGFIGTNLCAVLQHQVKSLRGFDFQTNSVEGVEWYKGNFATDHDTLDAALARVDIVFHLIHTTVPASSNQNIYLDAENNILPTIRLLEACRQNGVKKVVYVSSGGTVYGRPERVPVVEEHPTNPTSAYGVSKLAIEKYLTLYEDLYGIKSLILRVANPFGPHHKQRKQQGVVNTFLSKALANELIEIWGDGHVVRDYIYIDDVLRALLAASTYSGKYRVFNIGSGEGMSLQDVLTGVENAMHRKVAVQYLQPRVFDVPVNVLDCSRASVEMNWRPVTSFQAGLQRTLDWYRARK